MKNLKALATLGTVDCDKLVLGVELLLKTELFGSIPSKYRSRATEPICAA